MKYKMFNLSFDDIHPETSKNLGECGGDRDNGVFKYFKKLWKEFPEVKITLFVVPNWIYKPPSFIFKFLKKIFYYKHCHNIWKGFPFKLTKHKTWVEWLNKFDSRIEICIHGCYHFNFSNCTVREFEHLSFKESRNRLIIAENIMKESGLNFVKGFRPPGWGISENLFKALSSLRYKFISLSSNICNYLGISFLKIEKYRGIFNIPQNWGIEEPIEKAIKIYNISQIICAKGHICKVYGNNRIENGLSEETFQNLLILLEKIYKKVKFVKMMDMIKC